MTNTVVFQDLRQKTPQQLVELIITLHPVRDPCFFAWFSAKGDNQTLADHTE
jgi:hypothetical protein